MHKPIILVDGSSYLYRAFHAMPALTNSKGRPTGAIYGMVNMLRKLISQYDPSHMAVVFDAKGKTFRDELYDQYKANRSVMPSELTQQIETIYEIIKILGIPIIIMDSVEADDVIGTLAKEIERHEATTLISTSDKDLAQLVNKKTILINTMTETVLNPETVVQKFGIPPELIVDYLTLVGDAIDNIPGVPQVGPKTAVKWLLQYGSLDNIVTHAAEITGKVGENLRIALPLLPLSKQLATIKIDVDLGFDLNALKRQKADEAALREIYQELEFKNYLHELLEKSNATNQEKHDHYKIFQTEEELKSFFQTLSHAKNFAICTQCSNLAARSMHLDGISIGMDKTKGIYIPIQHKNSARFSLFPNEEVVSYLKPILEHKSQPKILHNIKFHWQVLHNHGIHLQGPLFDIMLASYVLESSSSDHSLASLALKHLGWKTISFKEIAGKGSKEIPFNEIGIEIAAKYATEEADVCLHLYEVLKPRIEKEKGLKYILEEIEIPLAPVLARIEKNGVLIDVEKLQQQDEALNVRLQTLEAAITKEAGYAFNLNSPKQLQEVLFTQHKLPILQKTPKGQPSTADAVLQELALEYLLPKLIIEYRAISKLITTYTKKLPTQIDSITKRIHTFYNQTATATGRLSSSEPNLQNIPVRTVEGRRIREAFIAPPGYKIIVADYSQIELRLMAHMSEDPNLLTAFAKNLDIHTATAAEVLNLPLAEVSHEERRKAKAINFGLIYGMSAFGLAKQIGVSREAAQTYIDRYFERYPKVLNYMENTRQSARAKGYVETLWGRRLYIPDIHASQIPRRKAAERAAINAPLQGSAADIIKRAMLALDKHLQAAGVDAKLIMQVHDELVFEVAEKEVLSLCKVIREQMMAAAQLRVPLLVGVGQGDNWNAAAEAMHEG